MAQRRMFNKSITNSSKFLKMPMSSRLLYYDLGMNADDDGYVEHFMVLRMTGATQQDLGVLEVNGLVKVFDENVLWIRDWKENNYIQKDRYTPSKYLQIYNIEEYIEYEEKRTIPLTMARQKRLEAKKESSLPSTFENTIRNAFIGKDCPICKKTMSFEREIDMPSIQHNIPISLSGKHEIDNISVICRSCNCSIQNKQITEPYNTEEVKKIWECVGNVYTGKDSIGKISIDNKKEINKEKNIKKEKYGTYGRVKLTIDEYLRLADEFGEDFIKKQIELLDEYIESNNNKNKYTNFNLVLRKSIRENWFNKKQEDVPKWFDKENKLNEITEEEQNEMEELLKEIGE